MNHNHPYNWHEPSQGAALSEPLVATKADVEDRSLEDTLDYTRSELERERKSYQNLPYIYLTLNQKGSILMVNDSGATRLGYTAEKLRQKSILSFCHSDDRQSLSVIIENLWAASSNQVDKCELRLVRKDKNFLWVKAIVAIQGEAEKSVMAMVCEDITEQKIAQVELENLNRLKDEFLSTVSHELRTPLTSMKMAIQMLALALNQERDFLSELAKPPAQRSKAARYFQILHEECEREISLIDNFLDLQHLEANVKPLVVETIQLEQWLPQVVKRFQGRVKTCKFDLQLSIAPMPSAFICDPTSLERILVELLNNAYKYTPAGENITLVAQQKDSCIQLQVINSGVEIPAPELPRIFEKFYRIPSHDPWKQGGTGLGLALVQKLVQHLGGIISVKSGSSQTCFTVELPLPDSSPRTEI